MTTSEKANMIIQDIKKEEGCNPVHIFKSMVKKDYIRMPPFRSPKFRGGFLMP